VGDLLRHAKRSLVLLKEPSRLEELFLPELACGSVSCWERGSARRKRLNEIVLTSAEQKANGSEAE
jgi:hypothetical protein